MKGFSKRIFKEFIGFSKSDRKIMLSLLILKISKNKQSMWRHTLERNNHFFDPSYVTNERMKNRINRRDNEMLPILQSQS